MPPVAFDRLGFFLDRVAAPNDLGYGYNKPEWGRSPTETGLLVREFMGWGPHHPRLSKGVETLAPARTPADQGTPVAVLTFYATQVMHHAGGRYWQSWNARVRDMLIDLQDQGADPDHPHQKGSWSPRATTLRNKAAGS